MATITKDNTFSAGATIVASEHNSNFDTIYNDYNGNITNANLSGSAAIADTKLAQLTTASKVNLTALVISSQVAGDIIFASSATVLTRLAAGSVGAHLESVGTAAPIWASSDGHVIQTVNAATTAIVSDTALIPYDDSIPTSTDGTQILSRTITPGATANKLIITLAAHAAKTSVENVVVALYDSGNPATGPAIAATATAVGGINLSTPLNMIHFYDPAVTTELTFTVRLGAPTGTTHLNAKSDGTALFGGVSSSELVIQEIKDT